jgi:hypothetical protein
MNNNMSKLIDVKALGKALMLTGSVLLGAILAVLLVKYASSTVISVLMVLLMVGFFYFIFKD